MLTLPGTSGMLGAAGEAWSRFMGGDLSAWVIATVVLMTWMLAPVLVAVSVLNRRDL